MGMTPELTRAELEFIRENRLHEELLQVCTLAQIEYGRIDFGVDKSGRLQIWEINTHPTLPPIRGQDLLDTLCTVDRHSADSSLKVRHPIVYLSGKAARLGSRGVLRLCPGRFRERLNDILQRLTGKILDTRLGKHFEMVAHHERWIRFGGHTHERGPRT